MQNIWYDKIQPREPITDTYISWTIGFISLGLIAPFLVTYRKSAPVRKNSYFGLSKEKFQYDKLDIYYQQMS